jgi:hypothetical protein
MNKVNEKQVSNLEEMDEREAQQFVTELFSHLSPEEEYNMRHEERERWYIAEPFEAPQWRARWVERMETGAPPRKARSE